MAKNKHKFYFPEQKTANIHLKGVHIYIGAPSELPPEFFEALLLIQRKKIRKAFILIETAFDKNPYNLLLRIRYAEVLLLRKKHTEALALFNHKRDLRKVFPEKKWFTAEEYISFLSFLGHLSLFEKRTAAAEEYHYLLYKIAPQDIRTKALAKKIRSSLGAISRLRHFFSCA